MQTTVLDPAFLARQYKVACPKPAARAAERLDRLRRQAAMEVAASAAAQCADVVERMRVLLVFRGGA